MKKFVAAAVCAGLLFNSGIYAAPAFAASENYPKSFVVPPVFGRNAYVPAGIKLRIELSEELSSKKAQVGDEVPLRLAQNLIVNGVIVAPKGSPVRGVVTKAHKASGFGRGGNLQFKIVSVEAINGVEIPLQYTTGKHGDNDDGAIAVFALVSMVGGIFMKGKNAVYNAGRKFYAEVTEDTDLQVSLDYLAEEMDRRIPHGVSVTIE